MVKPISAAFSLKECLQMLRQYLHIKNLWETVIRLENSVKHNYVYGRISLYTYPTIDESLYSRF